MDKPQHPFRPVLFEGDFPPPTDTYTEITEAQEQEWQREAMRRHSSANFEAAVRDKVRSVNEHQGGSNALPWAHRSGPLSPHESESAVELEERARFHMGGLPDEPSVAPVA